MEHYVSKDKWCIYYHRNKINGKVYIGQSKNTKHRFVSNGVGYKENPHFWSSIQKYGWDNFEHEILIKDLTKEQADIIERELIKKYDLRNPDKGYNIADGGTNPPVYYGEKHHCSRKVFQYDLSGNYISEWVNAQQAGQQLNIRALDINKCARKECQRAGKYMWSYEKLDSLPSYDSYPRGIIIDSPRIYRVSFYGELLKVYDDIHKIEDFDFHECDKILQCCKGNKLSSFDSFWFFEEDYCEENVQRLINEKFNNRNKGGSPRTICMYDLSGNYIRTFLSKSEAADYTGLKKNSIFNACRDKRGYHKNGDYLWYYYDDTKGENVPPWNNYRAKPILQFDLDGNFVEEYQKVFDGVTKYGSYVQDALKRDSHKGYNYLWFYKSDIDKYIEKYNLHINKDYLEVDYET